VELYLMATAMTFEAYQYIRKTNPDLYYKPSTQKCMRADQVKLGDAFFQLSFFSAWDAKHDN